METFISWRSSTISEKLVLLVLCPSMNCFNAFDLESWCCLLPSRRKGLSILLQKVPALLRRNVSGDYLRPVPTFLFHLQWFVLHCWCWRHLVFHVLSSSHVYLAFIWEKTNFDAVKLILKQFFVFSAVVPLRQWHNRCIQLNTHSCPNPELIPQ